MSTKRPGSHKREVELPGGGQIVRHYVTSVRKARLRRLLKESALRWAERDRRLAEEWSALGEAPDTRLGPLART